MEIQLKKYDLPSLDFNFNEVKEELAKILADYDGFVVSESNLKDAKQEKVRLNKIKKEIDEKRKAVKKEYQKPLKEFENKMKELTTMINDAMLKIAQQLNYYDEKEKQKKHRQIVEIFNEFQEKYNLEKVYLETIQFPQQFYNKSFSLNSVRSALETSFINLKSLQEQYKQGLDNIAKLLVELNEKHNLQPILTLKDIEYILPEKQANFVDFSACITQIHKIAERQAQAQNSTVDDTPEPVEEYETLTRRVIELIISERNYQRVIEFLKKLNITFEELPF